LDLPKTARRKGLPPRPMSHFSHSAWTHPTTSEPRPAASSGRASDSGSLLSGGATARGESRRIAAGLAGLARISIDLLNFASVRGARERLSKERWSQLSATLEAKREEVRTLLWQFQHQAEYIAGQPVFEPLAEQRAGLPPAELARYSD